MPQIRTLLGRAQQSVNQANTDVTFKRPDRAYVEYLISSEILLHIIPRHKDYPVLNSDRGEWGRIYRSLCKVSHFIITICFDRWNAKPSLAKRFSA